jgi:hypothetical protein
MQHSGTHLIIEFLAADSDVDDHERPMAAWQHGVRDVSVRQVHLARFDHDGFACDEEPHLAVDD